MASSIIFIDGTNLDARLLDFFGRNDVDFKKFFAKISQGTQLQHVHYCSAPYVRARNKNKYAKQMADFNFLRSRSNVTLHLGRFQLRPVTCRECNHRYNTYKEKGTDILVATRFVDAAFHKRADRLILISNDNDFWPALELARQHGVEIYTAFVIDPDRPTGDQLQRLSPLRQQAHGYLTVDDAFMQDCWRE